MNDGMAQRAVIGDEDGRIDNPCAVADGFAAEVSVRPLRLHTAQVEEGGLGGHCFSADFARYLAKVKPRLVIGWQMRVRYWWASSYGRQRVFRGFVQHYGADRGVDRYRVALCRDSGFRDARAMEIEARHTGYWCDTQVRIAQRFASGKAQSIA